MVTSSTNRTRNPLVSLVSPVVPRQAARGISPDKIFPRVADGEVYCFAHGVQLGIWLDDLTACESLVSYYTRTYGGVAVDPADDPDRCVHAAERVELAVDDDLGDWACVHCIVCAFSGVWAAA